MRKQFLATTVVSALIAGCGSPGATTDGGVDSQPANACSYVATGAESGSGSCSVFGATSSGGVAFTVRASSTFSFAATLSGLTMLSSGTYGNGDAAPGYGAAWVVGTGSYDLCSTAQNCNDAEGHMSSPQGSFSLTITDPGPTQNAGSSALWASPHGSLTVTMPAQPAGPEQGTVVVTATF